MIQDFAPPLDRLTASDLPVPADRPEFYSGTATKRAIAWVIDGIAIWTLGILALPFTAFTGLFFFAGLIAFLGFLYRWAGLSLLSATPGMRLMSVELRAGDGARLDTGMAFLHTLGYAASISVFPLQMISAALMATTARGQGLSDHILGTVAINRPLRMTG